MIGAYIMAAAMLGLLVVQRPVAPDFSACNSPQDVCDVVDRCLRGSCREAALVTSGECLRFTPRVCAIAFFEEGIRADGHALAIGKLEDGRYWVGDAGRYSEVADFAAVKACAARTLHCEPAKLWWAILDGDRSLGVCELRSMP